MESKARQSRILGTGRALPARALTNDELTHGDSAAADWIERLTGIRERRVLESTLATSDLAANAGRAACLAAGIYANQLSSIMVATATPDTPVPSTAVHVQRKLGADNCMAFDLSAACAGFLYGLAMALSGW